MTTKISFNDKALKKFSGGSTIVLEKWIKEFDEISDTCGWNEVQKYIFALKLMEAEADACVRAHTSVTTYDTLIALLKKEYKEVVSTLLGWP